MVCFKYVAFELLAHTSSSSGMQAVFLTLRHFCKPSQLKDLQMEADASVKQLRFAWHHVLEGLIIDHDPPLQYFVEFGVGATCSLGLRRGPSISSYS